MKGVALIFAQCPGKSAEFYKKLYLGLDENQRKDFANLSIEQQIGLLKVPVRRQNRYRKSGIEDYLTSAPSKRNPNLMKKDEKKEELSNINWARFNEIL